jgi:arginine decarboxylase-like protein
VLHQRGKLVSSRSLRPSKTPLVIRLQDMLHHRGRVLNKAFNRAIAENKFRGHHREVFPIKVNQLREVVEEILAAGRPFHYGLEVGSKPEMYAALAMHTDPASSATATRTTPSSGRRSWAASWTSG